MMDAARRRRSPPPPPPCLIPVDRDEDDDQRVSSSISDSDGPAAAVSAGVRLSPTGTDNDSVWSGLDAAYLSSGSSSSYTELTSTTRDKVDAAAPSSPSAAVESDQLGSALGASDSSTQRMSPAEWTAMTTVVKSSTSASACDHTSGKLHLTESLGSVGRCVRQTSSPLVSRSSPDGSSVTAPPRLPSAANRSSLDFQSLKQKLEQLMTSSGTVVSDRKLTPKDSKCCQLKPSPSPTEQRAGNGVSAARLFANAEPTASAVLHSRPHHRQHQQQQLLPQQLQSSSHTGSATSSTHDSISAPSQSPFDQCQLVAFILRTSPMATLLSSYVTLQALQCDFHFQLMLLRHWQERLQLAMRHEQQLLAVQNAVRSLSSSPSSPSSPAAAQCWLDPVGLYALVMLSHSATRQPNSFLPFLSSPVFNQQVPSGEVHTPVPTSAQWLGGYDDPSSAAARSPPTRNAVCGGDPTLYGASQNPQPRSFVCGLEALASSSFAAVAAHVPQVDQAAVGSDTGNGYPGNVGPTNPVCPLDNFFSRCLS